MENTDNNESDTNRPPTLNDYLGPPSFALLASLERGQTVSNSILPMAGSSNPMPEYIDWDFLDMLRGQDHFGEDSAPASASISTTGQPGDFGDLLQGPTLGTPGYREEDVLPIGSPITSFTHVPAGESTLRPSNLAAGVAQPSHGDSGQVGDKMNDSVTSLSDARKMDGADERDEPGEQDVENTVISQQNELSLGDGVAIGTVLQGIQSRRLQQEALAAQGRALFQDTEDLEAEDGDDSNGKPVNRASALKRQAVQIANSYIHPDLSPWEYIALFEAVFYSDHHVVLKHEAILLLRQYQIRCMRDHGLNGLADRIESLEWDAKEFARKGDIAQAGNIDQCIYDYRRSEIKLPSGGACYLYHEKRLLGLYTHSQMMEFLSMYLMSTTGPLWKEDGNQIRIAGDNMVARARYVAEGDGVRPMNPLMFYDKLIEDSKPPQRGPQRRHRR